MLRGRALERVLGVVFMLFAVFAFVLLVAIAFAHAGEGLTLGLLALVCAYLFTDYGVLYVGAKLYLDADVDRQ